MYSEHKQKKAKIPSSRTFPGIKYKENKTYSEGLGIYNYYNHNHFQGAKKMPKLVTKNV